MTVDEGGERFYFLINISSEESWRNSRLISEIIQGDKIGHKKQSK